MGSKTGGAVTKLTEKSKHKAMAKRMGTHKPMISRISTSHHEKVVALRVHQQTIAGGFNPGAVETFRGDGLPDEVIPGSKNWADAKVGKTMAERAEEDKRAPLKDEMVDGWKPQHFDGLRLNRTERRALARKMAAGFED